MGSGNTSSPNFGDASQRFIDAGIPGYALLPIVPATNPKIGKTTDVRPEVFGKAPGRWHARSEEWVGLGGAYIVEGVPDREQEGMCSWPTPNVGVLGRYFPGIDSDASSDAARRLIENALIDHFGKDAGIAERWRGNNHRRLYAFKASHPDSTDRWVRTRHLVYRLKNDPKGAEPHKLDIQAYGTQYLIAGQHNNRKDKYTWSPDFDLCDLVQSNEIESIENKDMQGFLELVQERIEADGGEVIRQSGGSAPGLEVDHSALEPILPIELIFEGLEKVPNTLDDFPTRDDIVTMVSRIRAALGSEAEANFERVLEWGVAEGAADEDYIEKIWNSLERGQRVRQDSIFRIFRQNGVYIDAAHEFEGDTDKMQEKHREKRAAVKEKAKSILDDLAENYVFGPGNTRDGQSTHRMRYTWSPTSEWTCEDWWALKSLDYEGNSLIEELKDNDRYGEKKDGIFKVLRDLRQKRPECFYEGETRNPLAERGEIVIEEHPDGSKSQYLNMRFQSAVLRFARRKSSNPDRDRADVATILGFMKDLFGEVADYELDTLAHMLQTKKRPGHLLFLVGDQGVGKSIYISMLVSMFDGIGKDMGGQIDGSKIISESSRRFALAKVEGCRIIAIKELPDQGTPHQMALITSAIKQIVDAGPDGDYIQIERKGQDAQSVRNFARVIISSNYRNAIPLEDQDRRTFYVSSGINLTNKPEQEYYVDVTRVTTDPERLAAFARFLMDRDVAHYDNSAPPPTTSDKSEATIAGLLDPIQRHMAAALEVLKWNGRRAFDTDELAKLMTAMAENEFRNVGVDDRREYDLTNAGGVLPAFKRLARYCVKLKGFKSNNERSSTIYAFKTWRVDAESLKSGHDVNDYLEADRRAVGPLGVKPTFERFRGPTKPRNSD